MNETLIKKLAELYLITKEMGLSYMQHARNQESFLEIQDYLQNSKPISAECGTNEACCGEKEDCGDCPKKPKASK